jgi:hypothetical protein
MNFFLCGQYILDSLKTNRLNCWQDMNSRLYGTCLPRNDANLFFVAASDLRFVIRTARSSDKKYFIFLNDRFPTV